MKTVTKVALKILQKSDKKIMTGTCSWNSGTSGKKGTGTQDTQWLLLQQRAGKKIQTEWVKKENGWRQQDEEYEKTEKLQREF